jgi:DNA-binding GntR family transcriptional regulator
VAEHSIEEILKIYDVLIALEGASCRLACAEISGEELETLAEYNARMGRAADEDNADLVVELNNRFHWLITEAARNAYLLDMRANFRRLVDPITRHFPAIPGQIDASLRDHQTIITALRNRNVAMAEFVMRDHLENAKKNLKKHLNQWAPPGP